MHKKLVKHGSGYAIEIESPLLETLKVSVDADFEVVTDGVSLIITPVRATGEAFQEALKETHERFGRALRKLGE